MHQTFLHRHELEILAHFSSKNNIISLFSEREEPVKM